MRILWVDDQSASGDSYYRNLRGAIDELARSIEGVTTSANEVISAIDGDAFLTEAEKSVLPFDLMIIDFVVPPTSGIELARQLLALVGNVRILFLSGWVVQFNPGDRVIDPRAVFAVLDKPEHDEPTEAWAAGRLLPAVLDLMRKPMQHFVPFDVRLAEECPPRLKNLVAFDDLSFAEQMGDVGCALEVAESAIESVFQRSQAAWIVFTWPEMVIGFWGAVDDDVPAATVREFERAYGRVAIRAGRPLEIGEVGSSSGWSDCRELPLPIRGTGQERQDSYPSILVEIEGLRAYMNIDTGSVCTFVDLDHLDQDATRHLIPPRNRHTWRPEAIAIGPQKARSTVLTAILQCRAEFAGVEESTVAVTFRARVVDGFKQTGLAKACAVGSCLKSAERDDGLFWCGHRVGLIGRDLLRLNNVYLILDSYRRQSFVMPAGPESALGFSERASSPTQDSDYLEYGSD